jgi:hypothetical protein
MDYDGLMGRLIAAFVRHGHYHQPEGVPSAHCPHPLTERGLTQAREAVDLLWSTASSEGWSIHSVIDSSRMLRAWQPLSGVPEGVYRQTEDEYRAELEKVTMFEATGKVDFALAVRMCLEEWLA